MTIWNHARRSREAINTANHRAGWSASTRIVGGLDDPHLPLLTSRDPLTQIWPSLPSAPLPPAPPTEDSRPRRSWIRPDSQN